MTPRNRAPRESSGGVVVVALVLGLVLLLGGGYVTAYLVAGDKVPRGTTVAGVDIGGHSRKEAAQVLAAGLAARMQDPIPVIVGGQGRSVSPGIAGLSVDLDASVAAGGGGKSWSATRLWRYYTDGAHLSAILSIDDDAMTTTLKQLAAQVDQPAKDGAVSFTSAGVSIQQPIVGRTLDLSASRDALVAAFAEQIAGTKATGPVQLPTKPVEPAIDATDVQAAVQGFANAALSGPVTLKFEHASVRLPTREVVPLLSMHAVGGVLKPVADEQLLLTRIGPEALVGHDPVDATVGLVDASPAVVPAVPGTTYDGKHIAAELVKLLGQTTDRTGDVPTSPVAASFGNRAAKRLDIRKQIATITTKAPPTLDLASAAASIDGTVLKPGDAFSLDALAGSSLDPVAAEQLASTTYDAAFSAGLDITERHAPTVWAPRLPVGRDAAFVPGSEDLQFSDNTPHGVLISASAGSGSLTVTLWSTAVWDMDVHASAPYGRVDPGFRISTSQTCVHTPGRPGFSIDVTRTFTKPGGSAVDHTESVTSSYEPVDEIKCRKNLAP